MGMTSEAEIQRSLCSHLLQTQMQTQKKLIAKKTK